MPAAHVAQGPIAGAVPAPLVFECAFAPAWPGATDRIDPARMELERHVARRTAELEAANRELEAFSYSVSHDLQAPLRQIDGFVELLVRDAGPTLSAASREILDDISGAARHMATLIDTLLEFSRAGRASLRPVDVNLDVLARDVVRELSRGTAGRAIEWSLGRLPTVRGDRTLLRQVFVNLLANAVKYTRPRARARIEVGTFGPGAAGDVVCFVGDNGVGFDMRRAHRLFGVFQRLHAASDFEGTGIGLASVQRIVHRHGGRVWATGVVGEGATFFFSLPGGIRAGDAAPATGGGGDS
jgi:light-regulated signal transduction histidine kinase (bacteriophytochrome)